MTNGSGPGAVFAFLTAPRKLQSLGAAVQADAAATSSARSTIRVVTSSPAFDGRWPKSNSAFATFQRASGVNNALPSTKTNSDSVMVILIVILVVLTAWD